MSEIPFWPPRRRIIVIFLGAFTVTLSILTVLTVLLSPSLYLQIKVNSSDEAKFYVDAYLKNKGLELEIKEIIEFSNHFYVVCKEKEAEGVYALQLLVDKYSAEVTPEPGPNNFWNWKYGARPFTNVTMPMPVSEKEAMIYAQYWLDSNIPGSIASEIRTFYGYYTIYFTKNGVMAGWSHQTVE